MRTGNVLLLLLLVLIGFGFLLYYSIDMTRELNFTQDQLAQAQASLETLEAQYQALVAENERLNEQITRLTEVNDSLQSRLITLENDRNKLLWQIEALQRNLALFGRLYPILAWLVSPQTVRLAAIITVPIVPISFGAVYIAKHHKAPTSILPHNKLTHEELQSIEKRQKSLQLLSRLPKRNTNLIAK